MALLAALALLAGCSGDTTDTATTGNGVDPVAAVTQWLDALMTDDVESLEALVEPEGLAVVAAVENNLRADELVGLLRSGFDGDLAAGYWSSFRNDFEVLHGESLGSVTVGDVVPIPTLDDHVVVAISTESRQGQVVLRRAGTGWQIDFIATIGPALVGPLGEYIASALTGEHAAEIAAACSAAVVPGLDAAMALDQGNTSLEFETEYIRQLVAAAK